MFPVPVRFWQPIVAHMICNQDDLSHPKVYDDDDDDFENHWFFGTVYM